MHRPPIIDGGDGAIRIVKIEQYLCAIMCGAPTPFTNERCAKIGDHAEPIAIGIRRDTKAVCSDRMGAFKQAGWRDIIGIVY
jgi:hypothetical protein